MKKFLVLTGIPKDEQILKKVLKKVEDHSWNKESLENWMNSKAKGIYYNMNYDCYLTPTSNNIQITKDHKVMNYKEIL